MASGARRFKFISPGVFINEIDQSQLPALPTAIGPVIIGRTQKGPGMVPYRVSSFEEYSRIFGAPVAGGSGGDNWRNGSFDGPTYGAFAAQAWLRSGQAPVTVVRLLGAANQFNDSSGVAGWRATGEPSDDLGANGGAYGLFLIQSASVATNTNVTGALAAVFYMNQKTAMVLTGSDLNGAENAIGAAVYQGEANGLYTMKIYTGGAVAAANLSETVTFNFNRDSDRYIRKVFNTNASQTNSTVVDPDSVNYYTYWLGETFDQFIEAQVTSSAPDTAAVLLGLSDGESTPKEYADFNMSFQNAETAYFRGQDLGTPASWNLANMTPLFKLVARETGEWASKNIKVAIENLRAPDYPTIDPYGSFSVVLRRSQDRDEDPQVLERFDNLNINPNSENYIGRRIGDRYLVWDADNRRHRQYGTYPNVSVYVRVVIDDSVAEGGVAAELLPFGYFGPPRLNGFTTVYGSTGLFALGAIGPGDNTGVATVGTLVTGSSGIALGAAGNSSLVTGVGSDFTGSFLFPAIRTRLSASDGNLSRPTDAYWGIQTSRDASSFIFDPSYYDMVRPLPDSLNSFASGSVTDYSFTFSMDNIVSGSSGYFYRSGSRVDETSYTALPTKTYRDLLDAGYDRFTAPLHGGFDGLNITEKEPFRNSLLSGKTEINNYAYNSLKRAIDTVADPEVVEANLMTVPGVNDSTLTEHLIDVCERRGDALAIIDLQNDYVPTTENYSSEAARLPNITSAIASLRTRGINSSYGCCFFPWVQIRDTTTGRLIYAPPSVAALGTFGSSQARTELWFAPAGFTRGGLSQGAAGIPVTGVSMRLTSKNRDDLYSVNINPIATFPNEGIVIFGQKTLQISQSALDRINVRRLMIFVKKEISRIANSILFEPNVQVTWDRFTGAAEPFLADVKSRFGLTDFRVILDETTTTPDLVDRNILYAKIFLKPARAIEFIALDFIITRTGASFED